MTYQRFNQLLDTEPDVRNAVMVEVGQRLRSMDADSGN
jgi:hypothetical protein